MRLVAWLIAAVSTDRIGPSNAADLERLRRPRLRMQHTAARPRDAAARACCLQAVRSSTRADRDHHARRTARTRLISAGLSIGPAEVKRPDLTAARDAP